MNNTNNYSARMSYENAKKVLFDSWIKSFDNDAVACMQWVESRKLSQSEVRLEVGLNITNNRFVFGVTPNQANSSGIIFPTERRLDLQNTLIASEYGVYVGNPTSNTDTAFQLFTYGNTQVFTAASAVAIDSEFYSNGFYRVLCNNDVVAPYRGLLNNWYKGQTQQTAPLGPASPKDQFRGAEDGQITQEPNLLLIGSKNYQPEIVLHNALVSADAFQRAVIIYRGIEAQNSTVIN